MSEVDEKRMYECVGQVSEEDGLLLGEGEVHAEWQTGRKERKSAEGCSNKIQSCSNNELKRTYKAMFISSKDTSERANADEPSTSEVWIVEKGLELKRADVVAILESTNGKLKCERDSADKLWSDWTESGGGGDKVEISKGGVPGMVDGEAVQVSTYVEFESTKLSVHPSLRLFGAERQKRPFIVLRRTVLDVFSG